MRCVEVMGRFGLSVFVAAGLLAGCQHDKPNVIYMPEMVYQSSLKAQEPGSLRQPVPGTVPRGFQPYPYPNDPDRAGRELKNPATRKKETLVRGKELFEIYCLVCHGPKGAGDGTVVPQFPRPPSLTSDRVRDFPDGRIYHIITMGQNLMPGYAAQIESQDRWAIVHYLRVLYRATHPTADDLKRAEKW